jgi:hypothetical protein
MPVVGLLLAGSREADAFRVEAVRQGLKETGYLEGENVAIEYRWGSIRSTASAGRRSGSPPSERDRHPRWHRCGARGKGVDHNAADRKVTEFSAAGILAMPVTLHFRSRRNKR